MNVTTSNSINHLEKGNIFPITNNKHRKTTRSTEIIDIINKENLEIIEMDKKNPLGYIKSENIQKFMDTPMTRGRNLEVIKEGYPNFYSYLEQTYKNNPGKSLIEFGSGEGNLLNDLIERYNVKGIGFDGNHPKKKTKYLKWKGDIRNFDSLPKGLSGGISLCTFLYIPNSIFGLETIFNKMKPGSEVRIDMGPKKLYSKAIIDYLKKNNQNTGLTVCHDSPIIDEKGKVYFSNLAVHLYKKTTNNRINVPDKYIVVRGKKYKRGSVDSQEEIKASPYFCHYFLEDDDRLLLNDKELEDKYQKEMNSIVHTPNDQNNTLYL